MKVKDLFKAIQKTNDLAVMINANLINATFYVEDKQYGDEFVAYSDFVKMLKDNFIEPLVNAILNADLEKSCYANTLIATVDFVCNDNLHTRKVEFFIDMY